MDCDSLIYILYTVSDNLSLINCGRTNGKLFGLLVCHFWRYLNRNGYLEFTFTIFCSITYIPIGTCFPLDSESYFKGIQKLISRHLFTK